MYTYEIVGPCGFHPTAGTNSYTTAQRIARTFGKGSAVYRNDTGNCILRTN